jgi:hypothetical protein
VCVCACVVCGWVGGGGKGPLGRPWMGASMEATHSHAAYLNERVRLDGVGEGLRLRYDPHLVGLVVMGRR